jgi:hypothetical protein
LFVQAGPVGKIVLLFLEVRIFDVCRASFMPFDIMCDSCRSSFFQYPFVIRFFFSFLGSYGPFLAASSHSLWI